MRTHMHKKDSEEKYITVKYAHSINSSDYSTYTIHRVAQKRKLLPNCQQIVLTTANEKDSSSTYSVSQEPSLGIKYSMRGLICVVNYCV